MRIVSAIALAFATSAISATALSAADASHSLLSNGGFETLVGITAADWPLPAGSSIEIEKGNHFLRLKAGGSGSNVTVYRQIAIDQAKALRLSYRVRWSDVKRGAQPWHDARIIVDFKGADGKVVPPSPSHPFFTGSGGWEKRGEDFAVPTGATFFTIMPAIFEAESGTFDLDDVQLVVIKPEEIGKSVPAKK